MPQLSVVIVNYNVKHFLEQVLLSVQAASQQLDVEVWVVDNNSVDGSMGMVESKFPWVKTIINKENVGFSKANNQAINASNSPYVLLLNPDTVLEEDTLVKCLDYMDSNLDVGGLGVRMIDGKGRFLPESKRGLPTPKAAFYKMTGLAAIFPKSKEFGRYHMKYLPEFDTNEVDVLAGAFMFLRKKALDEIGLLDEQFFMYGEDIDLSYRIRLGGYKNVYYPDTTIIHYKGESTKKKSVNYVKVFYNAMVLFAKKHYPAKRAGQFAFWIQIAIYFRAFLAVVFRALNRIWLPIIEFLLIYVGYFGIARYWEAYHKFVPNFYPLEYYLVHIPVYTLITLLAVFVSGGYDKPFKSNRIFRGALAGSILLYAMYAFSPKDWQFSRAILALGSAWAVGAVLLLRTVLAKMGFVQLEWSAPLGRRIAVVASNKEFKRITELLNQSEVNHQLLVCVSPDEDRNNDTVGSLSQLSEVAEIYEIDVVIFSAKEVKSSRIIQLMSELSNEHVELKIAPDKGEFIIGSNSKNEPGELFTLDVKYALSERHNRRRKRIFDGLFSFFMVTTILFPFLLFNRKLRYLFLNVVSVIGGSKTWVSYDGLKSSALLPKLCKGVIYSSGPWTQTKFEGDVNHMYAKEYQVSKDLYIIWEYLRGKESDD